MNALDFGKVFMKWALVPVRNFEWIKKAYAYTRLYFVVLHIEKNPNMEKANPRHGGGGSKPREHVL